jgi:hypothetical protein
VPNERSQQKRKLFERCKIRTAPFKSALQLSERFLPFASSNSKPSGCVSKGKVLRKMPFFDFSKPSMLKFVRKFRDSSAASLPEDTMVAIDNILAPILGGNSASTDAGIEGQQNPTATKIAQRISQSIHDGQEIN